MKQLLSGLEHCHNHRVLHRDIKGSNLLIDGEGMLKIADFGLATFFDPKLKHPLTNRVVTLWYRSPELLLGATHYGVGIDLWSAGCILAELLAGRPIMPGRTEVIIWFRSLDHILFFKVTFQLDLIGFIMFTALGRFSKECQILVIGTAVFLFLF